jgi:hypothetical protein
MFMQRNQFRGFGASPLDSVTKGPYWPQWPDKINYNLAHLLTPPTAEGGTIGGLGNILNNMASMIKYMDNTNRAASKSDAQGMGRTQRLGLLVHREVDGTTWYEAI